MARKPRLYGESGFYHVILRGNNRQNLFNEDQDRLQGFRIIYFLQLFQGILRVYRKAFAFQK